MSDESGDLSKDNLLVLDALQATLGLVSAEMRAIAVQRLPDRVMLHFALRRRTVEVDDSIEEMVFELNAILEGKWVIDVTYHIGPPDMYWPGRKGRILYLAKDANE